VARAYNNAIVLIRFFGVWCITIGLIGLAYIVYSVAFFAVGGESWRWLVDPALTISAQGFFGNPLYLVAGVILIRKSRAIAGFIAKYCEQE